jgi:uncharacterized protein (TIGR03066 family)
MRKLIGAAAVIVLAVTTAAGQDKIDGKLLIGKWEPVDLPGASLVVEFAEKGKLSVSVEKGGKSTKVEGTYKLDGNKLEMALKLEGKEQKETITVTTLSAEEFIGKDEKGKEEKLRKIKTKN